MEPHNKFLKIKTKKHIVRGVLGLCTEHFENLWPKKFLGVSLIFFAFFGHKGDKHNCDILKSIDYMISL